MTSQHSPRPSDGMQRQRPYAAFVLEADWRSGARTAAWDELWRRILGALQVESSRHTVEQ